MRVVDAADFTRTMAQVPSPVTVVTTTDAGGRRWGFTASSFSSLSLDPPMVLVCPAKSAASHDAFVNASHFMVNVLSAGQSDVARSFARSGHDKFATCDVVPAELGLPGLPDATARLACARYDVLDGGDHSILVGWVEAVYCAETEPLVYHNRNFTRPETSALAVAP